MQKDERFDPEELERVKAEAAHCGGDEAEEQRLIELGRKVTALLDSTGVPAGLDNAVYHSLEGERVGHEGPTAAAWDWFRSALREDEEKDRARRQLARLGRHQREDAVTMNRVLREQHQTGMHAFRARPGCPLCERRSHG